MIKKILFLLIVIGICFCSLKVFATEINNVSIVNLIATPEKYDGKLVRIFGFVKLEFEGTGIYLTEADLKNYLGKNGLWLDGIKSDQWDKYNGSFPAGRVIWGAGNAVRSGGITHPIPAQAGKLSRGECKIQTGD